ncbi:GntR family transcriptional regulator [Acuticoccus sp. MNP-M23]|uniref:GntR family transcriptional regulator n=1 Tax=Acuticoccus sp. MNP-M23 TaxID=3072793 RepID=UPI002814BB15|nr:GntR family transcriptional regulator [Acuticoccus sp. MNP-M23]WMS44675.1 GntR family transcriptional regulator [Acuticoccus sp. MNP-M23]
MNVSDKVHLVLRRRLMAGYYDPGAQLKEESVAADLDVSRTPVRAAIQRLIAEGLLEPAAKRGAIVTPWRIEDAEDIFNLRILLEGYGAALSTRNASDETFERMHRLNEEMAAAARSTAQDRLEIIHKANYAFHLAIYEDCGSAHLRTFGSSLLEYPLVIGGFYIYTDDDMDESIRQHTEIISALRARNAEWATAAIKCHLSAAIVRFRRAGTTKDGSLMRPPPHMLEADEA